MKLTKDHARIAAKLHRSFQDFEVEEGDHLVFTHDHPNKTLQSRSAILEGFDGDTVYLNMDDNMNDPKMWLPVPKSHLVNDQTLLN